MRSGAILPQVTLHHEDPSGDLAAFDLVERLRGKRVVLIGVPAAFSPLCHHEHVPSVMSNREQLYRNGVEQILFLATDTPFAMAAWRREFAQDERVLFVSDALRRFGEATGLLSTSEELGLCRVMKRFTAVIDSNKVARCRIEPSALQVVETHGDELLIDTETFHAA